MSMIDDGWARDELDAWVLEVPKRVIETHNFDGHVLLRLVDSENDMPNCSLRIIHGHGLAAREQLAEARIKAALSIREEQHKRVKAYLESERNG